MIVKRRQMDASVPAMAMGDIAFLLLIFFVILARARDDSHLQWKPASGVELVRPSTMNASVVIDKYNVTHLNGREVPLSGLSEELKVILGENAAGRRTVILKVHHEVTAIYFEPVIEAISEAGGELHHILEEDKQR
jgi:biopolymer transport protein ExbD